LNAVLKEILTTKQVSNGSTVFPLHSNMSPDEGELITRVMQAAQPTTSLEVGFAYGISALYACEAIAGNRTSFRHIVIDPNQSTQWHGIGLKNVQRAGYGDKVQLREKPSEIALPELLAEGTRVQAAIIDGWHTFDHTLVDFFYVNKMLDVGGIVILDDTNWPSVLRVVDHLLTYPAYELFATTRKPALGMRGRLRQKLAQYTKSSLLKRTWDYPACMAFRKITADDRNWDWHRDF